MRFPSWLLAILPFVSAQDLNWSVITGLDPLPTASVPVVYASTGTAAATAATLTYSQSAVLKEVSSALKADPSDGAPLDSALAKRGTTTTSCLAQPTGAGPLPAVDNDSSFLSFSAFSSSAKAAPTPSGYVNAFTNLQASNNAYGYLGYTTLSSYDTQLCATKCTKINGCQAFNVYFERDPTQNPDSASCSNPFSITQIKCVFWGGPVSAANANNAGQWRNQFHVVIAGSNGYVNKSLDTPTGYANGAFLDTKAIKAPLDCNGNDTSLGQVMFANGTPFDPKLCATACTAKQDCHFFNTYILYMNGTALGQNCALYSQTWTPSSADNLGYWNDGYHYTVGASYIFSNAANPGVCKKASTTSTLSTSTRSSTTISSSTTLYSSTSSSTSTTSTSTSTTTSSTSSSSSSTTSTSSSSSSTTSTSSGSHTLPPISTTTIAPAGITDTVQPSPTTVTPSIMLPTTTDINGIKPSASHAINFGQENDDDTTFHFNVNVTSLSNTTIVNMENFIPFITHAACGTSEIALTFSSADAMKMASDHWPSNFTLLTSDAAYCGDGSGGRTFYNASSVSYDQNALVATIAVAQTEIIYVCSRITTDFGTVNNTASGSPTGNKKSKRAGQDRSTGFWMDTSVFSSFLEDFAEGFDASYSAIVDLNPAPFNSLLNPDTTVDNRIQCPDCGLSGWVTLYGGYDWSPFSFNYVKAGFMFSDAKLNVAFQLFGVAGYQFSKKIGLDKIELPGIEVPGLIGVSPTVSLEAEADFELVSGGATIADLGVAWQSSETLWLEWDLLHSQVHQSGWDQNLAPTLLQPTVNMVPSGLSFRGSIGPAFGIKVSALTFFHADGEIGLDTPYVEIDLDIMPGGVDTSQCYDMASQLHPANPPVTLGVTVNAGMQIYADFSASFSEFEVDSGKITILDLPFPILASACWIFDAVEIDNNDYAPGFV